MIHSGVTDGQTDRIHEAYVVLVVRAHTGGSIAIFHTKDTLIN